MSRLLNLRGERRRRLSAWAAVLWAATEVVLASPSPVLPVERLFLDVEPGAQLQRELPPGPAGKRVRFVRLNANALPALSLAANVAKSRLLLNLFPDLEAPVVLGRAESIDADHAVSLGRVESAPGSRVILARARNAIAGSVFLPGQGAYQIQCGGGGQHRIVELLPATATACDAQITASSNVEEAGLRATSTPQKPRPQLAVEPALAELESATPLPPDALSLIDLLVLHTEAARKAAGGPDGIEAVILAALAEVNLAFENSGVRARVRLSGSRDADYHETGQMSADLAYLSNPDSDLREWREQARADLVCMIVETSDGPYGTANYMDEISSRFARQAFSVVQRRYANGLFILAHELGHNLGCQHDRENATTIPPGSFNYGYRFAVDGVTYRTVMAPQPGLPIAHYSNPEVTFLGVPTGVEAGLPGAANNALRVNQSAQTAAAFHSPAAWTHAPSVRVLRPAPGELVGITGEMDLRADASDADGEIARVEFLVDGQVVARANEPPFEATWRAEQTGTYAIAARAVDDAGAAALSVAVSIRAVPLGANPIASRRLTDRTFQLRVVGQPGKSFVIEGSSSASDWLPLQSGTLSSASLDFVDAQAPGFDQRFYRVLPQE